MGFIGILSSLLQGGYVRRQHHGAGETGPINLAVKGMVASSISLALLASIPWFIVTEQNAFPPINSAVGVLYLASSGLAFTSATVVNSLNALCSLDSSSRPEKGKILGEFRSVGQLGRSLGPLFATGFYFIFGPSITYIIASIGSAYIAWMMNSSFKSIAKQQKEKKNL